MLKPISTSILLFLAVFTAVNAQNNIEGVLFDADSKEPISFANVVVLGSYKGTASNLDGEFILKVDAESIENEIVISAIGYTAIKFPVSKYLNKGPQKFYLSQVTYNMKDITVEAKSTYYYGVIMKAASKVSENYYQQPLNYLAYYRNTQKVDGEISKERQAAVKIYDAAGYHRSNAYQTFREIGYQFVQARRNFELNSLSDGSTQLDDLLEFDIVRQVGNILSDDNMEDNFEVKLDKITMMEGDSVWVLKYKCKQPSLALTGDVYCTSYSGILYIKVKNYAIIKNITNVKSSNYSAMLGRSFYVNEEKQNYEPVEISYSFTTFYKEVNGKYFLSTISYERHNQWRHKQSKRMRHETVNSELLVTEITTKNPEPIVQRSYYEEIKFNKAFWDSFNYLVDEKLKK